MKDVREAAVPHSPGLVARVPVSFFSMVLGLAGLGGAWRTASRLWALPGYPGESLFALAAVLFVVLAGLYGAKVVFEAERTSAELGNALQGPFLSLVPVSLLVLAIGASPHAPGSARALFVLGAFLQLVVGLAVVGRWMGTPLEPSQLTPALYLPLVAGNLVSALAAGSLGLQEEGWLFFGAGLVGWVLVASILMQRHLLHGLPPPAARTILAIELAPPAVALLAWLSLGGGPTEWTARALLGWALFILLLLVRLAPRFRELPFGPSFWAFTFPLASLATAVMRMAEQTPGGSVAGLAMPLFVLANAVVLAVAGRTVLLLVSGKLLPPA